MLLADEGLATIFAELLELLVDDVDVEMEELAIDVVETDELVLADDTDEEVEELVTDVDNTIELLVDDIDVEVEELATDVDETIEVLLDDVDAGVEAVPGQISQTTYDTYRNRELEPYLYLLESLNHCGYIDPIC